MDYILQYAFYILILSILMGVSTWKLFKKLGYNPIFAFVPYYNYFLILKTTKHSTWWCILAYVPIVGPIMMSVFHLFLMRKFGKVSTLEQLLTVFLPFIYMAIVNYGKETEIAEPEFLLEGEVSKKEKDSFIGSITFAVVFATIIHTFVTQPFGIPTGSMERTLLVGDFLFVDKLSLGYRMPMRPLALPFLQGTIKDTGIKGNPKDDPKSYVDAVKLPYLRLPGWSKVERNDIVVFNYPQDSVHTAIDRKDPYVKRCVAVAGDVLEIKAGKLFVNNKPEVVLGDQKRQHAYIMQASSQLDFPSIYEQMEFIPVSEISQQTQYYVDNQKKYNLNPANVVYRLSLTDERVADFKQMDKVVSIQEEISDKNEGGITYKLNADKNGYTKNIDSSNSIFPINKGWNTDNYGPLKIPKKGDVVQLNQETLPEYQWIISEYEHHQLENKGGKIFVDGKESTQYTIGQNYYMMIGDNRDASLDARFFGFVPEENIVGKPMFTWLSVEGLFDDANSDYQANGKKVRWDRMFKATNTGEANKTSYWWLAAGILVIFFGWDYISRLWKKKEEEE
ncbi:signal peptidase I [Frigoriflavimonas asaccharolytica]|uniref:Signal peptidase I n=1 Tax=Frigoriflavimonas asaccharolytica TaxID=2735899 RepID=A0A8J8GAE9_9FLAO|nr:signal peptidase I [Frigoriflavimonas asaccharolytica]NRS93891.1 signal peptidase I [Frigoriflavimonas asaccharolytica]